MELVRELYEMGQELVLLYVEDDESLREQMQMLFKELFKNVDCAENGREGLEKYKNGTYDLVITDINMPEMNGIEMIHAIYKINAMQPIIVISAHDEPEYLTELLYVGVDSFLIKPIIHTEMVKTLLKVTKAIVNERLIKTHYQKIEELNQELRLRSEELQRSNIQLHEKNIALEKSMRIIEGMQHKDTIQRNITFPLPHKKESLKSAHGSPSQSLLKEVEKRLNAFFPNFPASALDPQHLKNLSDAVNQYALSLRSTPMHQSLASSLGNLAHTLAQAPVYTAQEELERTFRMLESFFFIYTKWEKEWDSIEAEAFKVFSGSIEEEIATLIDVWNARV